MPDFQRLTFGELCDRLSVPEPTLLLMHTSPDADTLGSCLALAALLEAMGSTVKCACADEIPEHLSFLADGCDCLSIPEGYTPTRVITVDVAAPGQLGALADTYLDRVDLMIDHHGVGTVFADCYVVPDAAATGEIIFDVAKELLHEGALFRIPEQVWRYCYAAISSDTGGFRFSNTTADTMRRGAELLEHGVDAADINYRLFSQKSYRQLLAESLGFGRMKLYAEGKVGVISLPFAVKREHSLADGDLGTLIDVVRSVRGVEIAAVIKQLSEEPSFRVSMRSSVDISVADICSEFGGGGHTRAAGCTVKAADIEDAERQIVAAVCERL